MAGSQSTRFVGYARVSTRDQETDLQLDALPRLRLLLTPAPIWFEPEKAKPRP